MLAFRIFEWLYFSGPTFMVYIRSGAAPKNGVTTRYVAPLLWPGASAQIFGENAQQIDIFYVPGDRTCIR